MFSLDLLKNLPLRSPSPSEEISIQDLDKIANCAENEQIDEIEELVQNVLEQGYLDIRIIVYYSYSHFVKMGVKSLQETLPIFMQLIEEHYETLQPVQRKEKHIESSFNWFFVHVLSKLKYNEKLVKEKKTPFWSSLLTQLSDNEFRELTKILSVFSNFFSKRWGESPTKERVAHIIRKIEDLKPVVVVEESLEKIEEELPLKNFENPIPEVASSPTPIEPNSPFFESIPWLNFLEKLKIFEKLIRSNDFFKAALVSADITETIQHFDPCHYFPKIFATYFHLLAKHADLISEQTESRETLQWRSLEKLYQVDIEEFSRWEA